MVTRELSRPGRRLLPSVFEDFFRPMDEFFDRGVWGRTFTVPAVNVLEDTDEYKLFFAVPGMKKNDFKIDIDGNMITVSAEVEEKKEETKEEFTREEYNFSSFTRTFTLPEEVNREKIEAMYTDGILKLILPKKEESKKPLLTKHVAVK
jgi:Molecular chaperone (small heat shock protein)